MHKDTRYKVRFYEPFRHWETAFFRNQGQCFKTGNDFW